MHTGGMPTQGLGDLETSELAELNVVYDCTDDGELMQLLFGIGGGLYFFGMHACVAVVQCMPAQTTSCSCCPASELAVVSEHLMLTFGHAKLSRALSRA